MAHLDWNRVRMELAKAAKRSPIAETDTSQKYSAAEALVMVDEGAISSPDTHRSPTVLGVDHAGAGDTDALLEHIALALADDADPAC